MKIQTNLDTDFKISEKFYFTSLVHQDLFVKLTRYCMGLRGWLIAGISLIGAGILLSVILPQLKWH